MSPELADAIRNMGPGPRQLFAILSGPGQLARHEAELLDHLQAIDPRRWKRDDRDVLLTLGCALLRLRSELTRANAPVELAGSAQQGWGIFPRRKATAEQRVEVQDPAGVWRVLPSRRQA